MIDWLINRAKRTPYFHLEGYMRRWWLVPFDKEGSGSADGTGPVSFWRRPITWVLQRFGIAIRVHEILRSDEDRDPHDHPWPYLTIILRGGYWESRYSPDGHQTECKWHGPGSVLYRPAGSWHRLDLAPDGTGGEQMTTTLFITGRYCQGWGFNVGGKKVPYREYLGK